MLIGNLAPSLLPSKHSTSAMIRYFTYLLNSGHEEIHYLYSPATYNQSRPRNLSRLLHSNVSYMHIGLLLYFTDDEVAKYYSLNREDYRPIIAKSVNLFSNPNIPKDILITELLEKLNSNYGPDNNHTTVSSPKLTRQMAYANPYVALRFWSSYPSKQKITNGVYRIYTAAGFEIYYTYKKACEILDRNTIPDKHFEKFDTIEEKLVSASNVYKYL